jgi:hypothetical protein
MVLHCRPISFDLPPIETAPGAETFLASLLQSVSTGDVTPAEASEVSKIVEIYLRARRRQSSSRG